MLELDVFLKEVHDHNNALHKTQKAMKTDENLNINQAQGQDIQRDSETPLPQKPSVLFITTTLFIIVTFITVIVMAYNGLTH